MKVRVHFYAQLRDLTGLSKMPVELETGATVSELLENIYQLKPALRAHDRTLLIGSGVDFVERDHALTDGEEIAIMPPVQGG
jgi:molybdopterin converting factor small subunit